MGKSTKDQRDHYYRQGKQEGYRARSAFKLLHLDEQYGLFGRPGHSMGAQIVGQTPGEALPDNALALLQSTLGESLGEAVLASMPTTVSPPGHVIDLCAAPGSWSQVLSRTLAPSGACIVAVDLQNMAPIDGVVQVVGDITTEVTAKAVEEAFQQAQTSSTKQRADLIICDGAPDVTGILPVDDFVHAQLMMSAVTMVVRMLRPGGTFVAKVFAEPHTPSTRMLLAQLRRLFAHVELAKPPSSRASTHRFT
ncbi:ribosomal rna methyltransferase 1 [Malassezia pachydermatis]|uniref:Ribosomal rna methyltransferase 1 n=1 Tax=Malassezia pachydermatis TaxID=77020 RepID=A0A0M9VND3_9BASI|nr:ribosomal rna methyltransferase 1 [Malassezia pachydermatis]KOS13202.1 ribosomal rna methyltransferase 1 [Malassezia pachydermatis]